MGSHKPASGAASKGARGEARELSSLRSGNVLEKACVCHWQTNCAFAKPSFFYMILLVFFFLGKPLSRKVEDQDAENHFQDSVYPDLEEEVSGRI